MTRDKKIDLVAKIAAQLIGEMSLAEKGLGIYLGVKASETPQGQASLWDQEAAKDAGRKIDTAVSLAAEIVELANLKVD